MLKLTIAVVAVALAGTASAAGWRSMRLEASDGVTFANSVAAFEEKLSPARLYVFTLALQDLWVQGTQSAEAQQRQYTESEYFQRVDGLGYDEIVALADPTGDTAQARYTAALRQTRPVSRASSGPSNRPVPIGPHGEQVRGTVDSGPAYQHSLRTMGQ